MERFAALYTALDETTKTGEKLAAMRDYFEHAAPEDAAWAAFFLSGRRIKRLIPAAKLRAWALEVAQVPDWLFDECHEAVGDFGETLALVLPPALQTSHRPLHQWVETRLLPLRTVEEAEQRTLVLSSWNELADRQRLVLNKLITGDFRVGVSQLLVVRALTLVSGLDQATLAHRLMGAWEPSAEFFRNLIASDRSDTQVSQPYPFCLAYPLEGLPEALGPLGAWQAEWKWDGIRAQLVRRQEQSFLWSRGEDLITERFPEIAELGQSLPSGTVLDGELLAWQDDAPLAFGLLQQRIGRKRLTPAILRNIPVALVAFDLLEAHGRDLRDEPLQIRRRELWEMLQTLGGHVALRISPIVDASSWEELTLRRTESRQQGAEGLMLKRLDSPYHVGRKRGDWWKWKISPYTVDAVLMYARRGHGRRASLYTDYTFGVWDHGVLVPFAKAYSGLTDEEIRQVDRYVREHTVEKFGPVRAVSPELVFELAFENIRRSGRHRSGVAVRFPRIARWRHDKHAQQADSLETLHMLIAAS